MKATGIVRRIDDLGRVVIPKEIRRTMRIREGDPLEIYTDKDGEVIFKKYSPMGELSAFATQMSETLSKTTGSSVAICDRDVIIALSGAPRKELVDKRVGEELEKLMEARQMYQYRTGDRKLPVVDGQERHYIGIAAPILAEGDVSGCVMFMQGEGSGGTTETEYKLAQTVAAFLGKQMEA